MPRVIRPKRKKPAKLPFGKLTPGESVLYQMRIYNPSGADDPEEV